MTQSLIDVSKLKDFDSARALDTVGTILTSAGVGSTGHITAGVFNGTIGATTPSTGVFTTVVANTTGSTIKGNTAGTSQSAGNIGETMGDMLFGTGKTATVTMTIAAPGVVTWTSHGFSTVIPQPVVFTTSGALPTGITSGTVYYTVPATVTTNTFQVQTTTTLALAGTGLTTSGTQSGTQTGTAGAAMANTTAIDVSAIALTAGDWDVWAEVTWNLGTTTTWTTLEFSLSQTTGTLATPGTVRGTVYGLRAQISAAATNGVSSSHMGPTVISVSATTNLFLVVRGLLPHRLPELMAILWQDVGRNGQSTSWL